MRLVIVLIVLEIALILLWRLGVQFGRVLRQLQYAHPAGICGELSRRLVGQSTVVDHHGAALHHQRLPVQLLTELHGVHHRGQLQVAEAARGTRQGVAAQPDTADRELGPLLETGEQSLLCAERVQAAEQERVGGVRGDLVTALRRRLRLGPVRAALVALAATLEVVCAALGGAGRVAC